MKKYEIFFFDVDGTLLDNQSQSIPLSTIQSIEKLKENGKKCVICSGRGFTHLKSIEQLNFIDWDAYILYNGALSTDKDGNALDKHTFSVEILSELEKASQENKIVLLYEGEGYWFNQPETSFQKEGMQFFGKHDPFPIIPYTDQQVCMICGFEDDFSAFSNIEGIEVLNTPHHYADIVQKGISKATGIDKILEYFNISLENTMAFGDGINDKEMLEKVNTSIAMGQSIPEIKEVATYVTTPVDKDGIYLALKHFNCLD